MSEHHARRKKGLVRIFVETAIDVQDCEETIKKCLESIDREKNEIILSVERKNSLQIAGGTYTTYVLVIGDSDGGWERSGMRAICDCLQASGYAFHAMRCEYSFIPNR